MEQDLFSTLCELQEKDGDGSMTYIMRNGMYLSGIPYLWSQFGERAYRFPTRADAEQTIVRFPDILQGATIHPTRP